MLLLLEQRKLQLERQMLRLEQQILQVRKIFHGDVCDTVLLKQFLRHRRQSSPWPGLVVDGVAAGVVVDVAAVLLRAPRRQCQLPDSPCVIF